jgi:hypothetical protein
MSASDDRILCPDCGDETPVTANAGLQQCAHCRSQFFLAEDDSVIDDENALHEAVNQQIKEPVLNTRHIRSISLERRAVYRKRTWVIVAAMLLIGSAGQAAFLAYGDVRQALWMRAAAFAVLAFGMFVSGVWFAQKIKPLTAEAEAMKLRDPETSPDFSTLSSGGQFVDALRQMAGDNAAGPADTRKREGSASGSFPAKRG